MVSIMEKRKKSALSVYIYALLLVIALLSGFSAKAENSNYLSSFEGRNFYVAFMQNEIKFSNRPDEPIALHLFFASSDTTSVTIHFLDQSHELYLLPNKIEKYTFKREVVLMNSEKIEKKAIRIEASNPITVCGINSMAASSDMFSAIPTQNWGKEYVVMSYPNDTYVNKEESDPDVPRRSQFCVLARENGTTVTITPTVTTAMGKAEGQPFNVTLNKGETYLVQSSNVATGGDLTGTLVTSDKPVGVISGHVRTAILQKLPSNFDTKDHLVEMLLPVTAWGKRFITTPFLMYNKKEDANLFRVVSRVSNNQLKITDVKGSVRNYTLSGINSFLEINDLHKAAVWESQYPIQIMQYMKHTGGYDDNINYDPSMTLIPPTEQYVRKILLQVPDNSKELSVITQYEAHYAMLVMEKKAVPTMRLDGLTIDIIPDLKINPIPNTDYVWARFPVRAGSHRFTSDEGRFSGILYGYGKNDSYSVILGSSLLPVKMVDKTPPTLVAEAKCNMIMGHAAETIDTLVNSGLDNVYIDKNYTQNYSFSISPIEDTTTYVSFTAKVIDENKSGTIIIYARDRSGNISRFTHSYNPLITDFSHSTPLESSMTWKDIKCIDALKLINKSNKPYTLISMKSNNPKVSIVHNYTFPMEIDINKEIEYGLCFDPKDDFSDIEAEISFDFECNKSVKYKTIMRISACEIDYTKQLDFQSVFIGKDKTLSADIINIGKDTISINDLKSKGQATAVFDYASLNSFPIILPPGETKQVKFKFTPSDKAEYQETFILEYDCSKEAAISLKGKGISSELADLSHDFGSVRLGENNVHTFTLTNSGNTPAPIKFKKIEYNDEGFDIDEFTKLSRTLQPGESFDIKVSFAPKSEGKKHLKAYFTLSLADEITYSMSLSGVGIFPGVSVKDHELGTIYIYSTKDTVLPIVNSTGTQNLLINNIVAESGDFDSFEYDLSQFNNKSVKAGEKLMMPIKFKPQFVGEHKVRFAVSHDASNEILHFTVAGGCIPYDTLSRNIQFSIVDKGNPCSEIIISGSVSNQGNVPTKINSLQVEKAEIINGELRHNITFPLTLKPGEECHFAYHFLNDFDTEQDINFIFNFDDNDKKVETYHYKPSYTMKSVVLKKLDNLRFNAGDTIRLEFSGGFPHTSHVPITSYLRIQADEEVIKLIPGTYTLELTKNSEKMQKELVLFTKNSYFDVPLTSTLDFKDSEIQWKIILPFVTYFKSNRYNNISYEFVSDRCFNSKADSLVTEMIEVCAHDQRDIQLVQVPQLKSYFIRENSTLVLEFENYLEKQHLELEIYDLSAQLVRKFSDINPKIGKNSISLDLSEIPDGVYFYKVEGLFIKENNKFIK